MLIDDMVDILCGKEATDDLRHYMEVISLYSLATITNAKRNTIVVPTDELPIPANIYGLTLAGSGLSKSRSLGYIKDLLIKDAELEAQKFGNTLLEDIPDWDREEATKLTKEGVNIAMSYKSATGSAVMAVRRLMDIMGIYGVNITIDEIGSTIGREYELLSDTLLQAFDKGVLEANLRRTSGIGNTINPVPHNLLLFGSPHLLFESSLETEKLFFDLLTAGLARRSLFANVTNSINSYSLVLNDENKAVIASISNKLVQVVQRYHKEKIMLSSSAKELYIAYEKECIEVATNLSEYEQLKKIYARNKYWLALKVSGILALTELSTVVSKEVLERAITIVNNSEKYFVSILNRPQKFEVFVKYLLGKEGAINEYTLTNELPFYKDVKSKGQFLELAKGYAMVKDYTFKHSVKGGINMYEVVNSEATDINKIILSYSSDLAKDYQNFNDIKFSELHKVVCYPEQICYSAHRFFDGRRLKDKAIAGFNLLILDIDDSLPLDMAKLLFEDYTYLIATTRNHQVEKNGKISDRYRIIIPTDKVLELDKDEYEKFYTNILQDLPIQADLVTKDISRMFFSADGQHYYNEGKLFETAKYIPNTDEEIKAKRNNKNLASKNISSMGRWFLANAMNSGRNNGLLRFALLLADEGYNKAQIKQEIVALNKQLDNPLSDRELEKTILQTINRRDIPTEDESMEYVEIDEFDEV